MHGLFLLAALIAAQDNQPGPDAKKRTDPPAPEVRERKPDSVLTWNDLTLEAIRRDQTAPPVAARNLAILHVAIYDSVIAIYYPSYKPYQVGLKAVVAIDPDLAAASAGHRVLTQLHPRHKALFDKALEAARAAVPTTKERNTAEKLGRYVAEKTLASQRGGSERAGSYRAAAAPGIWRPTPPRMAAALLPGWGEQRPFAVRDREPIRPAAPPALTDNDYLLDLAEVKEIGGSVTRKRTAGQSIIAWFWDDGAGTCTPAGHWNQVAREASHARNLQLPENARLFALLNIALADAGILCWESKYQHKRWRPITAVRETDPRWAPLLHTPPSPSYPSGHSALAGAAATVLAAFFGKEEVEVTVGSDGFPGTERTYSSFWQAAREAGKSRVYGGVQFESDNREGLALGKTVAEEVLRTQLLSEDVTTRGPSRPSATMPASSPRERP